MVIRILSLAALIACAPSAFAHEYKVGEVLVENPWSRELPVDMPGGAAYFTIHNHESQADRLVAVSSPRAQKCELHLQASDSGMMNMQHTATVDIPAHGEVIFQPGGNHVMLTGMDKPLKAGEQFPMTLEFEKAGKVEVQVKVESADTQTGHDEHAGHQADNNGG
ncbi:copper chaperone PCu(A)C [Pseudomonas akapageensis]|uniref:copper chaperone PCu(A)C n=1 Tax=Pseudomonas akapageensis TaxID=2609961 RepID=UPI00140E5AD7|nr:copper chaperone PCu(A)C [Pseudomonas akapageensis]